MNNDLNNLNNVQVETNEEPTPVVGPVSAPTPAMQPETEPPKKKNTGIIVAVVVLVLLVVGGVLLVTQTDIFKKDEETKTEEKKDKKDKDEKKDEKKEENPKDTSYSKYNGVYANGDKELKLFYDGERFRYIIAESTSGYLELKEDKWISDMFGGKVIVTINDDTAEYVDEAEPENNGTYKKVREYTLEDYFNNGRGNTKYFDTKFNGHYKTDTAEMYTYQLDEEKVRVIIITEKSNLDIEFDIKEDGSLYDSFFDDIYVITFDAEGNATYTTQVGEKEYDAVYKKLGKVSLEELVEYID